MVTGASRGLGRAIAATYASAGADVMLSSRKQDALDEAAATMDGTVATYAANAGEPEQAQACVAATMERFGRVDILVNNAGVMLLGPVTGANTEDWRRMVDINLFGLLYCTHAALPLMGEGGGGHIVNVSSVAGRIATMGSAVYNLTKWGVTGFSEALRQEALHAKVRVTCVEPGYVDTELQGHNEIEVVKEGMDKMRQKIGKVLEAEDIANAIVYAVSQPEHVSVNEVLVRPSGQPR
jgi:NADP-dependent 3-hydroxy acid dehydrogenase YdfG